jgi:phenylacetate-CoA ligase
VETRNLKGDGVIEAMKQTFQVTPEVSLLPRGTIAKEFEANIKAPRFVDKRG